MRNIGITFLALTVVASILLLASNINNRFQVEKEDFKITSMGQQAAVNSRSMNGYIEVTDNSTLVFMPGARTSSLILDFKSLYSILSSRYRIVDVDKSSYSCPNGMSTNAYKYDCNKNGNLCCLSRIRKLDCAPLEK